MPPDPYLAGVWRALPPVAGLPPGHQMASVDTAPDVSVRGREADAPRNSLVARITRPLKLDAGVELSPFQIAYKTHGTLNKERSNAIVFPTHYSGTYRDNEWLIGADKALDPSRYFIIVPNMLGNGLSSSPSNTPPPHVWNTSGVLPAEMAT